jgi:hypothetical protein
MRSFGMVKLARSAYHAKIWESERSDSRVSEPHSLC